MHLCMRTVLFCYSSCDQKMRLIQFWLIIEKMQDLCCNCAIYVLFLGCRDTGREQKGVPLLTAPLSKKLKEMKAMTDQLFRLNVRVSKENNDYLEKKSTETGISKSALVQIAVEQYRQQSEAVRAMNNMEKYVDQLEEIQREVTALKGRI